MAAAAPRRAPVAHRRGAAGEAAVARRALAARARDGERGSVLILVAICLSVLVTATAFTVDLGRISTTRRTLQNVADVTALDLSRLVDGRTSAAIVGDPRWAATLTASLARNDFELTTERTAVPSIGRWNAGTQTFTPTSGATIPDAVRVIVGNRIDYQFLPGGATTTRTGIAAQRASAGFRVGSFATRLDSRQSALLGALLGDALGITVLGYEGLAGGSVGLDALATELGLSVGTPDELLNTSVGLADLLRAEADVLRAGGDLLRANVLDQYALALPNPNVPVLLGDLLSIASGGEDAAALAELDALELLTTVAFVANGTSFLDLPAIGLTLPGGLATTTARVQVIERPRYAFGPVGTSAQTSQVRLQVSIAANVPGVSTTTITVTLDAASATGTSTALSCGSPQMLDLNVNTALVTSRTDVASTVKVLNIPVATVKLHSTSGATPTVRPFAFDLPPDVFGVPRQVPTPGLNLGGAALVIDEINVIGLQLPGVVNGLVSGLTSGVVTPLLTQLDNLLVTPLAGLLGLTLAGVDVTPVSIACSGPAMVR